MGCGIVAARGGIRSILLEQNAVEDGPGGCDTLVRRLQDDVCSMSRTPSVGSHLSSVTSLHSATKYHFHHSGSKKSWISDDLQSDVPTITESTANMEDFRELQRSTEYLDRSGSRSPTSMRGCGECAGAIVDLRPHPLAPVYAASQCESQVSVIANFCDRDLGCIGDVESFRDDLSVTSASELCCDKSGSHRSDEPCGPSHYKLGTSKESSYKLGTSKESSQRDAGNQADASLSLVLLEVTEDLPNHNARAKVLARPAVGLHSWPLRAQREGLHVHPP